MRIRVMKVVSEIVYASTQFGLIRLRWVGAIPEVGGTYFVELDFDFELTWGNDVVLSDKHISSVVCFENSIELYGVLDSDDCDGYYVLRMDDYIVPFVAEGKAPIVGSDIKVTAKTISAYPIDYA